MGFYIAEIRRLRRELKEAYTAGEYKKALILGKNILEQYFENGDAETLEYAFDMNNLGVIFDSMGMYEKAAEYYQKAANLKQQKAGDTLSYADTLNNLAIMYNQMEAYEKALELHQKVLQIRENKLGKNHIDTIHALFHIGNTYEDMKVYEKALEYQQKALEHARLTKDFPKLEQSDIFASLASVYEVLGNYKKAIPNYETSVNFMEKEHAEHTFSYMMRTLSLAEVCEKAGLNDWAVTYCEKAIQIRRSLMEGGHLDFINSLNSLGAICSKAGMYEKSLACHEEILGLVTNVLGHEHLFYADTVDLMSRDYAGLGQYKKALDLNLQAIEQKQQNLGKDHIQCAVSFMSLGILYEKMGEYENAWDAYRQALQIRLDKTDETSILYIDTLEYMVRFLAKRGAYDAAVRFMKKVVDIRKKEKHAYRNDYIKSLSFFAKMQLQNKDALAAEQICEEMQQTIKQWYHEKHPKYAKVLVYTANIYLAEQKYEQAKAYLEQAATLQKEMLDEDNPQYLHTLGLLADVAIKQHDFAAAAEYYLTQNDANFEETAEELRDAADTLMKVAVCKLAEGNRKKATAYYKEAQEKLQHSELEQTEVFAQYQQQYQNALESGTVQWQAEHTILQKNQNIRKNIKCLEHIWQKQKEDGVWQDEISAQLPDIIGTMYAQQKKKKDADKWYQILEEDAEGLAYAQSCYRKGQQLSATGDYTQALQAYNHGKNYLEEYQTPDSEIYIKILDGMGDCWQALQDTKKALQMYVPAVTLYQKQPFFKDLFYMKLLEKTAKLLAEEKRYQEAVEQYSEWALLYQAYKGEDETFSNILLKTAQCHIAQGNQSQGDTLLARVLLLGGKDGRDTLSYAKLCDRVGRLYASNNSLERAVDTLSLTYEKNRNGEKCMTKQGFSTFLTVLQKLGDEKRYAAAKEGKKLEESC